MCIDGLINNRPIWSHSKAFPADISLDSRHHPLYAFSRGYVSYVRGEMRRKLEGYGRVTDIDSIPKNTHIRYITWKNGKERFTLGGKLRKVMPKYIRGGLADIIFFFYFFHFGI